MATALITGITGQDGSYLAELLLSKEYSVHGVIRRASLFTTDRIDHLYVGPQEAHSLFLHYGDLTDSARLREILYQVRPDEIYHLGAQPHVMVSFIEPIHTADIVALGTLRLLESVRDYVVRSGHQVKVFNASSSEMFGASPPPQRENTPFHPRSPYAVGKVAAYWHSINYREAYGLFICNGILFNHESPRRGETFVTRKITRAVGRILAGQQSKVYLGNLEAQRDWGFAGDYVDAMWRMLQQSEPDDFVIATGQSHSVRDFAKRAFTHAGLDWKQHVEFDPRYVRPAEVDRLRGDPAKAAAVLGWSATTSFEELLTMMVEHDIDLARREVTARMDQRGSAMNALRKR